MYIVAKCDSFDSWATFGVLVDQEKCLSGIYLFLPGIMPKVRVPVPTNIATVPFRHYSYIHKTSDWLRFMDLGQIHMRSWYQLIAAVSVSVLIHLSKGNSIGTPVQTLIPMIFRTRLSAEWIRKISISSRTSPATKLTSKAMDERSDKASRTREAFEESHGDVIFSRWLYRLYGMLWRSFVLLQTLDDVYMIK